MRHEIEPEPRKAQLGAGASSDSERTTFSVPAEVPAASLTFCLTVSPAPTSVSLVVSLTASSPARRRWAEPSASASFRAGPSSDYRADRTCRAFPDHPLPTTQERVVGKRYRRGTGNFRPGPESRWWESEGAEQVQMRGQVTIFGAGNVHSFVSAYSGDADQ